MLHACKVFHIFVIDHSQLGCDQFQWVLSLVLIHSMCILLGSQLEKSQDNISISTTTSTHYDTAGKVFVIKGMMNDGIATTTFVIRHKIYCCWTATLHCTALHCTVLCCAVLYCTVLYCTVLYCTVLYCTDLFKSNHMRIVCDCVFMFMVVFVYLSSHAFDCLACHIDKYITCLTRGSSFDFLWKCDSNKNIIGSVPHAVLVRYDE